jgi:hypothetical protein
MMPTKSPDDMAMESVRSVAPPPSLSEAELAEFLVLQRSLGQLEDQWHRSRDGPNPDRLDYAAVFDREFGIRIKQAEIIEQMDIEATEKHFQEDSDRIDREWEENERALFKRFVCGYFLSYQKILDHLHELLGPDFEAYHQSHEIEFPEIRSVKNQKQQVPRPEEPRIAFNPHETDRQLRAIRQTIQDQSVVASEAESGEAE